jgi:predicted RNA binding protein YcfA (HicA-like mRNA interferase family)
MRTVSGRVLTKALERHGCSLLLVRGSHYIYDRCGGNARMSVLVDSDKPLKIELLKYLMKCGGISEYDL